MVTIEFLDLVNKQNKVLCIYLPLKNLEIGSKYVNRGQKAKHKLRMMAFEVKMQQDKCRCGP